jgi:ParB family chromosome partitioning protein
MGGATYLPVDSLQRNPFQPRTELEPSGIASLAHSIRRSGMLQPITVRERDGRYEIIAGERRFAAARQAGMSSVPILIRNASDEQMLELALIENLQREDLNAIDRAKAYRRFCTRFNLKPDDLAERLGEDRTTVVNYMRLLDLPESVQRLVAESKLGMGHARCLLGITDDLRRERLAEAVAQNDWSVRALEEIVRREKTRQSGSEAPAPAVARTASAHVRDLQQRFEQAVKTKVTIREGRRKGTGRIVIEYFSLDDFDRIASLLGVGEE